MQHCCCCCCCCNPPASWGWQPCEKCSLSLWPCWIRICILCLPRTNKYSVPFSTSFEKQQNRARAKNSAKPKPKPNPKRIQHPKKRQHTSGNVKKLSKFSKYLYLFAKSNQQACYLFEVENRFKTNHILSTIIKCECIRNSLTLTKLSMRGVLGTFVSRLILALWFVGYLKNNLKVLYIRVMTVTIKISCSYSSTCRLWGSPEYLRVNVALQSYWYSYTVIYDDNS